MSQDTSVKSQQSGVFRTNCADSLDRTNVVQSMLASRVLHRNFVVSFHSYFLSICGMSSFHVKFFVLIHKLIQDGHRFFKVLEKIFLLFPVLEIP